MAFTGIKYCKSPAPDIKKQNSRSIMYDPVRFMTTATSTMPQSKSICDPFVHLTGHKLVADADIPPSFDIMSGQSNFEEYDIDKSHNFAKNSSFKNYNQFPMLSFSQLVGGFVGSKSQLGTKNRESHQIWDIVIQKLDEFINCKPTEKYSQHYYEFSSLSQDIIGSFCRNTNSPISYILKEECQSFKATENIENTVKSSPVLQSSVESSPTTVNTSVSVDSFVPSHPSCNKASVPVLLEFVEHIISQPNTTFKTPPVPQTPEVIEEVGLDQTKSVLEYLTAEPSADCGSSESESSQIVDYSPEVPPVVSEGKQSYAEVAAKMSQIKPKAGKSRPTSNELILSSKQFKRANKYNFSRNSQDPRQRFNNASNWRSTRSRPRPANEQKEVMKSNIKRDFSSGKYDTDSKSVPGRSFQGHGQKSQGGMKYFRHFEGSSLKTVPEMVLNNTSTNIGTAKDLSSGPKVFCCFSRNPSESSCQSINLTSNRKSCQNWRCRQHVPKPSVKRGMKYILKDSTIEENLDDQSVSSDPSPTPTENCVRLNKPTLASYITKPRSSHRPTSCNNLKKSIKPHCDSNYEVQSLPVIANIDNCVVTPTNSKDGCDLTRLSESSDSCSIGSLRPSSESGECLKVPRSRSISEESKGSSTSTSSLNSCKLMLDANFRRRFSSECDSEDSFVVFEGGVDFEDCESESDSDFSEDDDDDELSDLESNDECDSVAPSVSVVICIPLLDKEVERNMSVQSSKMEEVNKRWGRNCSVSEPQHKKSSCKKVNFAASPDLETVHRMVAWDYAYRAARCGPWEEMARDRDRFGQRVERTECVLAPVLGLDHRERVYEMLRTAGRHDMAAESKLR